MDTMNKINKMEDNESKFRENKLNKLCQRFQDGGFVTRALKIKKPLSNQSIKPHK